MNLPPITPTQQAILTLLYRQRFLTRNHLQHYLNHKDKRQTGRWLKDLHDKQYVAWIYDGNDPMRRSTAAVYYLDSNGIRYLRSLGYPEAELRKRYKDNNRQQSFIAQCLLVAEGCLHVEMRNAASDGTYHYAYALAADYMSPGSHGDSARGNDEFGFLADSAYIHPDLVFTKTMDVQPSSSHTDGSHATRHTHQTRQTYLVELFDLTTPRYMVKKHLKGYVNYLASDAWEAARGNETLPIVLIACPTVAELLYAKRYTRKLLSDLWDDDVPENVIIRFSTIERLQAKGMTAVIWED